MHYAISTTWKHDEPIDDAAMEAHMRDTAPMSSTAGVVEVIWFKIDDHTHGSLLMYESEDSYLKHQEELKTYRKSRPGLELLREERGPTIAIKTQL
ncbi:MAG: hypothetical protein CME01_04060 [Geminicoccus sp.]|nr:hypothetical protein [Geminicoccus sp.]